MISESGAVCTIEVRRDPLPPPSAVGPTLTPNAAMKWLQNPVKQMQAHAEEERRRRYEEERRIEEQRARDDERKWKRAEERRKAAEQKAALAPAAAKAPAQPKVEVDLMNLAIDDPKPVGSGGPSLMDSLVDTFEPAVAPPPATPPPAPPAAAFRPPPGPPPSNMPFYPQQQQLHNMPMGGMGGMGHMGPMGGMGGMGSMGMPMRSGSMGGAVMGGHVTQGGCAPPVGLGAGSAPMGAMAAGTNGGMHTGMAGSMSGMGGMHFPHGAMPSGPPPAVPPPTPSSQSLALLSDAGAADGMPAPMRPQNAPPEPSELVKQAILTAYKEQPPSQLSQVATAQPGKEALFGGLVNL